MNKVTKIGYEPFPMEFIGDPNTALINYRERWIYMNTSTKYLRVTIHDNDFTTSLEMISDLLYETFQMEGRYPTKEDFPVLKECIKHLWFGEHMVSSLMRWGKCDTTGINYFEPRLEFIDYLDIPDWDNAESVYIPMFDNSEVLMR